LAYIASERETYFNYSDEDDNLYIYTCSKSLIKKLDGLCIKFPSDFQLTKQDECSKSYISKKKFVSIRAPKVMSASHKSKLQENAKKMLESQGK